MHLAQLPNVRSEQEPACPCLTDEHRGTINNAVFAALVETYARRFRMAGTGPGDVIAIMLPNRIEFIVALFAAWRIGAVATPVNPALEPAEAWYQVNDSEASLLIAERPEPLGEDHLVLTLDDLQCSPFDRGEVPAVAHSADDLALLAYARDGAGPSQVVALTHADLAAMVDSTVESMRLNPEDHSLVVLPVFRVNEIVVSVLSPLMTGGQATIATRFVPDSFFDLVARAQPTYFSAVTAICAMLCNLCEWIRPDTSRVRFAVCDAAPMPGHWTARFENRFGIPLLTGCESGIHE